MPPLLLLAIHPNSDADSERLEKGLRQLMAQDPTLTVETSQQTADVTIAASGELLLEIILDRLKTEFSVEATVGRPEVAYNEALTRTAEGEGRHVRQTGGYGQYAHVKIRIFPADPGTGHVFDNFLIGGAVPSGFVPAIREGIEEAAARGVLAGYPIRDVRIAIDDGSYHEVDSTETAFKIAGAMAFRDAAGKAALNLMEPLMRVEVVVPQEYAADVMRSLSDRCGQICSDDEHGGTAIIRALVPMAKMLGYAADLRSRTRGRATHSLQFDSYQTVRIDPNRDDDRNLRVGAPLRPITPLKDSSVALPEPED